MKIICDTNIWYNIATNAIQIDAFKNHELIATFINIDELAKTHNLVDNFELIRSVLRSIFKYKSQELFYPPFVHIKMLADKNYQYDTLSKHSDIFISTQKIAQGHEILPEYINKINEFCYSRQMPFIEMTKYFNEQVFQIKGSIKDKKKHRKENPTVLNRKLISHFVSLQTDEPGLSDNFDFSQIELLEKTMRVFFNELELSHDMKVEENDWYDLFQLAYVQPGMKYWTKEKRWLILIEKAGMNKYLFQ